MSSSAEYLESLNYRVLLQPERILARSGGGKCMVSIQISCLLTMVLVVLLDLGAEFAELQFVYLYVVPIEPSNASKLVRTII